MMKYLLLLVSINSYAMSFNQAQLVFNRLRVKGVRLVYIPRNYSNAEYFNRTVEISRGLLNEVRNEDEIALVLGHELGHYINGPRGSYHKREYDADRTGARLARRAGYNVCKGTGLLRRWNDTADYSHPSSRNRIKRLGC